MNGDEGFWNAFVVSRDTPAAATARLSDAFIAAAKAPEMVPFFQGMFANVIAGGPADTAAYIREQTLLYKRAALELVVQPQ